MKNSELLIYINLSNIKESSLRIKWNKNIISCDRKFHLHNSIVYNYK